MTEPRHDVADALAFWACVALYWLGAPRAAERVYAWAERWTR